jgi:predicted kinase
MEKKLLMLKGLPGCGKTKYALELVSQGWKRVNKDDLRSMVDGGKWGKRNEDDIVEMRDIAVIHYLDQGFSVVVDDTNFNPIHEEVLSKIAKDCEADFEVMFIDVPVMECIKRDLARERTVGADVIIRMFNQYLFKRVPYDVTLPDCYMVDIDGTLAKMAKRSAYEWDRVGEDSLNEDVAHIIDALHRDGKKIIIMSGRDSACEEETLIWLKFHDIPFDGIAMRDEGDMRADSIVKRELYEKYVKGKYNVLGVFDDRNSVVDLWRSLGFTCLQVGYGFF